MNIDGEYRQRAVQLSQALGQLAQAVRAAGADPLPALEARALKDLGDLGWQPDYLTVRRRADLQAPGDAAALEGPLVALGAARLGSTRLIDNLEF